MTRRKAEEAVHQPENTEQAGEPQSEPQASAEAAAATPEERKSTWLARFPAWIDEEAGVRLVEDRQNRRMTIQFSEKPSKEVRTVMKAPQYDWDFDEEDVLWYKKISKAKPRQSHQEAEALVLRVANMIREDKGLEPKKAFALGL